jgi:hypothetical protein
MEPRQIIRTGITASALAHLTVLMLVLFFADVHPFAALTAETISVEIVTPKEVAEVSKEPEPVLPPREIPLPDVAALTASAASSSAPPAAPPPQPAAAQLQKHAAPSAPHPERQQAAIQPQSPPSPQPPPAAAAPAYVPSEPDISVKYQVLLGLPQSRPGDGFDAPASAKADVASNLVTEFRRHLKTCAKLSDQIAASDKIKIKLRVFMTPDGRLAAEPALIEASASAKGPALMQSAIGALQACQPYTMLPSDRYGEWKVLDLSFSPQDFSGG